MMDLSVCIMKDCSVWLGLWPIDRFFFSFSINLVCSFSVSVLTIRRGLDWHYLSVTAIVNICLVLLHKQLTVYYCYYHSLVCFLFLLSALVITVDTPFLGRRLADVRNVFKLPGHMTMANFETKDSKVTMATILDQNEDSDKGVNTTFNKATGATKRVVRQESSLAAYVVSQIDPTLNWSDIAWVRSITKLPIVVKGVLTAEDAKLAADTGVEGILVSNHGGRQLDGVLATIDALPEVLDAVKGRGVEVYIDGGVRKGTDVLKALALGAKAVFLGRPILWGLAHDVSHFFCRVF